MLTVYGRATSSNVQALLWGMEELQLDYTRLDYGESFGGLDSPEFRAMSPHGKIPVLRDGDTAIWETPAILRYVAANHGSEAFWPRDPMARAQVDMWAEWAKHSVAAAFTGPIFWHLVRTRPERRDPARIAANLVSLEAELAKAEDQLARNDFLCADALTLADIQFGHVLFRYFDMEMQRANLPKLRAYYDRLAQRPAFQKTVMISYEVLRETF